MKATRTPSLSLAFALVAALSAGCASVAVTENSIEQRTAAALGVAPGSFVISDRTDDGVRSSYTVKTTAGKSYSCYVTGTVSVLGRVVSDAVCTELGQSSKQAAKPSAEAGACNALLKAAGRC